MADLETRVRVTAKTQGFDKLQQESAKLQAAQKALFQTTTRGFGDSKKAVGDYQKTVERLEDQLRDTAKSQLKLHEAILQTEQGSEVFQKLTADLKALDRQSGQVRKTIGLIEQAYRKEATAAREAERAGRAARGAFAQGFAQGAGAGEFIQRGPGALQQGFGRAAGRVGVGVPVGVARGLATTPFAGAGGIAQALGAIPLVGGPAGAALQTALGFTGNALAFQRQQVEAAPFLAGRGGIGEMMGARTAARQTVTDLEISERARMAGEAAVFRGETEGRATGRGRRAADPAWLERQRQAAVADATQAGQAERGARGAAALSVARRRVFGDIQGAGLELGAMSTQEALGFAGGVAQRGGGTARDLQRTGLLRAGIAAQTAFGVGPETTGAFLGAARRGGVVGGAGGDQMTKAIGDAMSLGLQGSEIPEYLESMAQGIEQWRQTGIPVNPRSIREMRGTFAGAGLGVGQGGRIAQGIQARAQGVAIGGPQTATDMMLLQAAGFAGGGIEQLQAARRQLEQGMTGEQSMGFLKRLTTATGGGAAGEAALQAAMNQMGITTGPTQAGELLAAGRGGPMSDKQRAAVRQFQEEAAAGTRQAPKSAADLEQQARDTIAALGPNLKRQADITNEQLVTGQKLLTAAQNFETATTQMASSAAVFNKGLEALGAAAETAASTISGTISAWMTP